jgi:hypothetical protein
MSRSDFTAAVAGVGEEVKNSAPTIRPGAPPIPYTCAIDGGKVQHQAILFAQAEPTPTAPASSGLEALRHG